MKNGAPRRREERSNTAQRRVCSDTYVALFGCFSTQCGICNSLCSLGFSTGGQWALGGVIEGTGGDLWPGLICNDYIYTKENGKWTAFI